MGGNKQNKVYFASGFAWFFDKFGNRKSVESLEEASNIQSECCGLNCCENTLTLRAKNANGVDTYPLIVDFVVVDGELRMNTRIDLGDGWETNQITIG